MSALSPRRAEHDALFNDQARKAFCATLRRYSYTYDGLARSLEGLSLPRPSAGSAVYRSLICDAIRSLPYAEVWEVADRVALLYRAELHTGAPLPADDAGYLDALTAAPCGTGRRHGHTASLDTVGRVETCARIGLWVGMGRTPAAGDVCPSLESE